MLLGLHAFGSIYTKFNNSQKFSIDLSLSIILETEAMMIKNPIPVCCDTDKTFFTRLRQQRASTR
jgi:hypothetical protein